MIITLTLFNTVSKLGFEAAHTDFCFVPLFPESLLLRLHLAEHLLLLDLLEINNLFFFDGFVQLFFQGAVCLLKLLGLLLLCLCASGLHFGLLGKHPRLYLFDLNLLSRKSRLDDAELAGGLLKLEFAVGLLLKDELISFS